MTSRCSLAGQSAKDEFPHQSVSRSLVSGPCPLLKGVGAVDMKNIRRSETGRQGGRLFRIVNLSEVSA